MGSLAVAQRSFLTPQEVAMNENPASRDKLMQDMKVVASDAEELLRAMAAGAAEQRAQGQGDARRNRGDGDRAREAGGALYRRIRARKSVARDRRRGRHRAAARTRDLPPLS